jgi:N6-adenosine-specific RNA methylase IME4
MSAYRTLVADPPWPYPEGYASDPRPKPLRRLEPRIVRKPLPYALLSVDEICALPVAELAHPDGALLFLWTTNRFLPAAFTVADAWGFKYTQTVVWHKTGCPSPFGGSVAPNHAEYLLVCRRGSARLLGRLSSSVVAAPAQRRHSQKPELFLDLIETVAPAPRVELFARRQRLGWDTWGAEALPHVDWGGEAA